MRLPSTTLCAGDRVAALVFGLLTMVEGTFEHKCRSSTCLTA